MHHKQYPPNGTHVNTMSVLTIAEENHLKSIYHLLARGDEAGTNAIARAIQTKPASVTDMLKKLAEKKLISYEKYQGVSLTRKGHSMALSIIRKHRLWEYFLVEKLHFKWDEVHEIAEQLEHIRSEVLIDRLDDFLGNPTHDPHGDPIPDKEGKVCACSEPCLLDIPLNTQVKITAVKNDTASFLKHLEKLGLTLGKIFRITERHEYDGSVEVQANDRRVLVSKEVACNLMVTEQKKK